MGDNLKYKTLSGVVWTSTQRFGGMAISFISNIVLARLLSPNDFGAIGMLVVFITLAETFIDGGLGVALIQKKDSTQNDYSVVFYWNLLISLIMYILLYLFAPYIAAFYQLPVLTKILRVQGLIIFIFSFCLVQNTKLRKELKFKQLSICSLSSTLIGTIAGILAAYHGFGVWSLVIKELSAGILNCIMLMFVCRWLPLLRVQISAFIALFRFGGIILLSNLLDNISNNLLPLLIGRVYSASTLGYYTQAKRLNEIPERSISQVISAVTFPIFSTIQQDTQRVLSFWRKSISCITFVTFPIMIWVAVCASQLVGILYGHQWDAAIPFLQILCIGSMLYPINSNALNIVQASGRGRLYLIGMIAKRIITIVLVFLGLLGHIEVLVWMFAISMYGWNIINMWMLKKIIGYGIIDLIHEIGPTYLISMLSGVVCMMLNNMYLSGNNRCGELLLLTTVYLFSYLSMCKVFQIAGLQTAIQLTKEGIQKIRK